MKSDLIVSIVISIILIAVSIPFYYYVFSPTYDEYREKGTSEYLLVLLTVGLMNVAMTGAAIALPIWSLSRTYFSKP